MNLDVFQELGKNLDVDDFVKLTLCNKKLRKLYHNNSLWKYFLERDFNYHSHPQYDLERYKECYHRKTFSDIYRHSNSKLEPVHDVLKNVINFTDWVLTIKGEKEQLLILYNIQHILCCLLHIVSPKNYDKITNEDILSIGMARRKLNKNVPPEIYGKWNYLFRFFKDISFQLMSRTERENVNYEYREQMRKDWIEVGFKKCW